MAKKYYNDKSISKDDTYISKDDTYIEALRTRITTAKSFSTKNNRILNRINSKPLLEQNAKKESKVHESKLFNQIDVRTKHKIIKVLQWLSSPQDKKRHEYFSLFIFSPSNKFRLLAVKITEAKLYEYFILLAIAVTCIIMALDIPQPNYDKSAVNMFSDVAEYYLLAIFGSEALLKIIAAGFVMHPNSYLRSLWNVIDFAVVVISFFLLVLNQWPNTINKNNSLDLRSVRAIRVLRPLKFITIVPSLQIITTSIMKSVLPILQVLYLLSFMIAIYVIIGLQFMVNRFKFSCKNNLTGKFNKQVCDGFIGDPNHFSIVSGESCAVNESCLIDPIINNGVKTFDNIFFAMITVFQCVTTDGWSEVMYKSFRAMDKDGYLWTFYFVSLVMLGAFVMVNLVLGVLNGEFSKERTKVEYRREFIKLREKMKLERSLEFYICWISKGEELMIGEEKYFNKFSYVECFSKTIDEVDSRGLFKRGIHKDKRDIHKDKPSVLHIIPMHIKILRLKATQLVKHKLFFWFVLGVVFLNTIFMATYHFRQPRYLDDLKYYFEIILGLIFIFELLLKVFAFTLQGYCKSSFNIFEFIVVFVSSIEAFSEMSFGLVALRCFILLRVFEVTKYWSKFQHIVASFKSAVKSIFSLFFLLMLFIFISALMGMHLFSGRFDNLEVQSPNFDGFSNSILAVFQVVTGEDWSTVMYNAMEVYPINNWIFYAASSYFLFLVFFGNYILLNIFLAIAVDNLANAEILTDDEEKDNCVRMETKRRTVQFYKNKSSTLHSQKLFSEVQFKSTEVKECLHYKNEEISGALESCCKSVANPNVELTEQRLTNPNAELTEQRLRNEESEVLNEDFKVDPEKSIIQLNNIDLKFDNDVEMSQVLTANRPSKKANKKYNVNNEDKELLGTKGSSNYADDFELNISEQGFFKTLKNGIGNKKESNNEFVVLSDSSLFIFSPTNRFRVICHTIVQSKYFDLGMIAIILIRSSVLAIEDPINLDSYHNTVSRYCDYIFAAIFGIEIFLKIVDTGFIMYKGSFLRSSWNRLDAFVFVTSLLSIILSKILEKSNIYLKVVRMFRVLRPIKVVQYVKRLKVIFQCMIYSFKNVGFILIIAFLMLFIFACIGVQLFQGKFYYCTDEGVKTEEDCKGFYIKYNEMSLMQKPRKWEPRDLHFDNVLDALVTLFICSTEDNWSTIMYQAMNMPNENNGPLFPNYSYSGIYFIVFMVIFTFLIMNVFVALIVLTFQKQGEKEIQGGLDKNQHDCLEYVLKCKPCKSFMPLNESSISFRMWLLVKSDLFDNLMTSITLINMLLLMLKFKDMPEKYNNLLIIINGGFTGLYLIEALLKIIAYRLNYFKDHWNLFDITVIIGGFFDVILTFYFQIGWFDPAVFRLFRVARLLKLLKRKKGISIILWTLINSLKNLAYVIALILIITYVYAIMGMQLFGNIELNDENEINKMNNFRNIFKASVLLFRCSSGDNWSKIMVECYDDAKCDEKYILNVSCGNTALARIYFISYMLLSRFFLLNLFVAVIMDNFDYLTRDNSIMCLRDLKEFVSCWSQFDPQATGHITNDKLYKIMCFISPPIGFGAKCPKAVCYKRLMHMNIPINRDCNVSFHVVLMSLVRYGLKIHLNKNDAELKSVIKSLWPHITSKSLDKCFAEIADYNQLTVGKIFSMKIIFMNFQKKKSKSFSEDIIAI